MYRRLGDVTALMSSEARSVLWPRASQRVAGPFIFYFREPRQSIGRKRRCHGQGPEARQSRSEKAEGEQDVRFCAAVSASCKSSGARP